MELGNVFKLSYEELATYTDSFSQNNYISHFQFGKLYRGKIVRAGWTQYVMVKIWEVPEIYNYKSGDNQQRLMDEIMLLSHEILISYPGMIKLYGYCFKEDHLGAVYEFKPFDSVFNLIPKDGFNWLQRIKVVLGLASLLKFLHTVNDPFYKPFIVRNLDCAHIVLDEGYNPKLCDFGLITGGVFPDRTIYRGHHVLGCYGYIDADAFYSDEYSDKQDVFAFGAILVNLISKRVYNIEDRQQSAPAIYEWASRKFYAYDNDDDDDEGSDLKKPKFSLVHQSLAAEPDFDPVDGHKISLLAIECMRGFGSERPTMKQVLRSLLKLKAVKKHADFLGVNKVLRSCENSQKHGDFLGLNKVLRSGENSQVH